MVFQEADAVKFHQIFQGSAENCDIAVTKMRLEPIACFCNCLKAMFGIKSDPIKSQRTI